MWSIIFTPHIPGTTRSSRFSIAIIERGGPKRHVWAWDGFFSLAGTKPEGPNLSIRVSAEKIWKKSGSQAPTKGRNIHGTTLVSTHSAGHAAARRPSEECARA